jgi:phenylacetic acid degradation operon negative regulatory protein
MLLISVPQENKLVRHQLYTALSWLGFGSPVPGVWVCPHRGSLEEARRIVHQLQLNESAVCFLGCTLPLGLSDTEIIRRAWDLDGAARHYRALLKAFVTSGSGRQDDSLIRHVTLLDEWRMLCRLDPRLPQRLTQDWIGHEAKATLAARREEWAPLARVRWEEIIRSTTPAQPLDVYL